MIFHHNDDVDEDDEREALTVVRKCMDYLWNYRELHWEQVEECLHPGNIYIYIRMTLRIIYVFVF